MRRLLLKKLSQVIPVLIIVSFGTTVLMNIIPGTAASLVLGEDASESAIQRFNKQYGFDRSVFVQYGSWLSHAIRGNLGRDIQTQQPITSILMRCLPITLELAVVTFVLSVLLSIVLALWSAIRAGGVVDRIVTAATSGLLSVPSFVSCVILLYLLAVDVQLFPPNGWVSLSASIGENLRHIGLPVLTLTFAVMPLFIRVLRGDVVAILNEDFVLFARSRGLPGWYVLFRHVLRPASLSMFTVSGLVFGYLFGGSVVVETFFSLPGLGNLAVNAVESKNIPIVEGLVVTVALGYVLVNAIVDIAIALVDPRVRESLAMS